jgi:hypothetical protein
MATKKTRIDRRGKIRPLVKSFPPVVRHHWKKRKAIAAYINRRDWRLEFYPPWTIGSEIEMEHLSGYYLVIEASDPATPHYIITE